MTGLKWSDLSFFFFFGFLSLLFSFSSAAADTIHFRALSKQYDPCTTPRYSLTIEIGNSQLRSDDPCARSPRFEIGGDAVGSELEVSFRIIASRLGELAGHGAVRSRDESSESSYLLTLARRAMARRRRGAVATARCRRALSRPHGVLFVRELAGREGNFRKKERKKKPRVRVFFTP